MTARVLRKQRRPGIACMDPARDLCALTGPQAVHLMSVTGVSRVEADKMAPKVTAVGVRATGGTLMFTYLGNVAGPLLFGSIAQGAGFGTAYAVLALPLMVAGWMLLRSRGM